MLFFDNFKNRSLLTVPLKHSFSYPTPTNLNYLWSFGLLSLCFLIVQLLTGIFLAMHFSVHVDLAFSSVEHIMRDVNFGWCLRYLHSNGASLFFIVVYCHMGRGLFYGSFYTPRFYLWISGILIFFLMMGTAFLGYVLPWGQMSFWGATVITNLLTALPLIGSDLLYWIWGGFSVSNAALNRFFVFHFVLPFVIFALVIVHLYLLHAKGSSNPLGVDYANDNIRFISYFYVKDLLSFLGFFFFFMFIVFFAPNMLGHPDNYIEANPLVTPPHIVPEWYFLPFYAILRSIPSKLGGVTAMVFAILILIFLPFCSRFFVRNPSVNYAYALFFFWPFVANFLLLGWIGAKPVEYPYLQVGIFATMLYFFLILVLLPLMSLNFHSKMIWFIKASFMRIQEETYFYYSQLLQVGATNKKSFSEHSSQASKFCVPYFFFFRNRYKHVFHLVAHNMWPLWVSVFVFFFLISSVSYFHTSTVCFAYYVSFFGFLFSVFSWATDVYEESNFSGYHTFIVQNGFNSGIILFIISEIMFFFGFFWAFFHSSLSNTVETSAWPPLGVYTLDPLGVPIYNTFLLLVSGFWITNAHMILVANRSDSLEDLYFVKEIGSTAIGSLFKRFVIKVQNRALQNEYFFKGLTDMNYFSRLVYYISLTVFFGLIFTLFQFKEYGEAEFDISDSVFGSCFYLATGFHGFHVLLGSALLGISLIQGFNKVYTSSHHFFFNAAAWYWHFVDVVWLGLYIFIYLWGS